LVTTAMMAIIAMAQHIAPLAMSMLLFVIS
jgi:hypothetical protein